MTSFFEKNTTPADPVPRPAILPGGAHPVTFSLGEVSDVNDSLTEIISEQPIRRCSEIEEDEAPIQLLIPDYEEWG